MINRLSSSIIKPKTVLHATQNASQGADRLTRFMKNKVVGKICETAADNPVICQSAFSLAICCGARPVTNMVTTKDKKDASYASCHSISSGVMGFVWPLVTATPLAAAVGLVLKKPQKFLKPSVIKKFYPNVGLEEVTKNGKKITRVMTNINGNMVRKDGTELCRELEPLKIKNGDAKNKIKEIVKELETTKSQSKIETLNSEKAALEAKKEAFELEKIAFEKENPSLYVDKNGVVRSREVFKTKEGKYQLDKDGNKMGCVVQQDKTPVTEEMELGIQKEQNIKSIINWVPDILLAPPRAFVTVACIPWLLKNVFGMEKKKKGQKPEMANNIQQQNQTNIQKQTNQTVKPTFPSLKASIVSNTKKGGV